MSLVDRVFDGSLMPHGHCLLWRGDLLFLHLSGDVLTSLAYFTIPAALVYLVRRRGDLEFDWIVLMFALFIFFCGVTHFVSIINIWHGYYFIEGLAKVLTGLVSLLTAAMVWRLMPRALAIPSQDQLREKVYALEVAEQRLAAANADLEEKITARTQQLEALAKTDELTRIPNRREVMRRLNEEIARWKRTKAPLSVLVIDVDDFKQVNDSLGHLVGDSLLQQFAAVLEENVREIDSLGRFGGEEFLVVLPATTAADALLMAERMRASVANYEFETDTGALQVTCSVGAAQSVENDTEAGLLARADAALYRAKEAGKNRVESATP